MFILPSITSGLEFRSVNHTFLYEIFELNIFENISAKNIVISLLWKE